MAAVMHNRVIMITAAGGPQVLQLRQAERPEPADNELLIAVVAAGINRHDCNQRRRGPSPDHSDVPGLEVAGVVAAVGARVRGWQRGDRVCALTDGGGYADFAVADADHAFSIPDGVDDASAACLPEAVFTVWHNFFNIAHLGPGESVLLHGGTSGVGTVAIQLLTALGHRVFATCGSAEKVAAAIALGAEIAFDYRRDDFVAGVMAATGGRGVNVILDMSGGRYSALNVRALARRGYLVHLSPGAGVEFQAPLREIMAKEARITGSLLRPLAAEEKTVMARSISAIVWPLIAAGRVRPVIHRRLPLVQADEAHALMERGEHIGKVVLDCEGAARMV